MRKTIDSPILAIDPGLRELGYAVLDGPRLLTHGVVPLRKIPVRRRWAEIHSALESWTRAFEPQALVFEAIPRDSSRLKPLYLLGQALRRYARHNGMSIASYSPKTIRKALLGNGWAGKQENATAVCVRFPQLRIYRTQDRGWKEGFWHNMYDAVAVGLYHQLRFTPPSRSRSSG